MHSSNNNPSQHYDIGLRKGIHFLSVLIPVGIYFTPPEIYKPVALVLFIIAVAVESGRRYSSRFNHVFQKYLGSMLKETEKKFPPTGATYLLFSAFILSWVFPKEVCVPSLLYLSVGDAIAGFVGKRWGRHKLIRTKTFEGSIAMFGSSLLVTLPVKGFPLAVKILGSLFATILEAVEIPLDDNVLIPLGTGLFLWILTTL